MAVPYENALSAYAGNCFFVAADGESGMIEPLPESSPIQSCAPTMTSGAFSTATVETSWRIGPDCFWTTWTVTLLRARPRVGDLGDGRNAVRVGPDDELGALVGGRGAGRCGDHGHEPRDSNPCCYAEPAKAEHTSALLER